MNNPVFSPLTALLSANDNRLIVDDSNGGIALNKLRADIAAKQQALQTANAKTCLIYRADTAAFISDLLACVLSGVNVVMPPNAQVKTYERIKTFADVVLGDFADSLVIPMPENRLDSVTPTLHDITVTLFTSGSTGQSKAISRPLSALLAEAQTLEKLWGEQAHGAVILSTVSHQHIYGLLFKVLWGLCYGHIIWRNTVPFEENLHHLIRQFPATVLASSPAFLTRLSETFHDTNGLRCVFSSGGALSQANARQTQARLNSDCIRVFGSTETGGIAYQSSDTDEWTAFPRVKLRQQNGVLQVASPYCYQQPWFTLADRVKLLDNRRFLLMGRVDDVVKIEEKRIALTEVENTLCQHPWVVRAKVLVLPLPRRCLGAVLVLTDAGKTVQSDTPRQFAITLRQFLGDYFEAVTLPKQFRCVEAMPEDAQGKIPREQLLALFNIIDTEKP